MALPGMAPQKPAIDPYEAMRRRVQQQAAAAGEQQQDVLKRQFAMQGRSSSGAAIRETQRAAEANQRATADAIGQVDAQEALENRQREMQREQMEFAKSEREGSQQFQGQEAEKQRLYSKDLFDQDLNFKKQVEANAEVWRKIESEQNAQANAANFMLGIGNLDWHPKDIENLNKQSQYIFKNFNPPSAAMERRLG